jgi:hypothetical protein
MSEQIDILQDGDLVFARLDSRRYPGHLHNLFYSRLENIGSCDCEGWFNNQKCWHMTALKAKLGIPETKILFTLSTP